MPAGGGDPFASEKFDLVWPDYDAPAGATVTFRARDSEGAEFSQVFTAVNKGRAEVHEPFWSVPQPVSAGQIAASRPFPPLEALFKEFIESPNWPDAGQLLPNGNGQRLVEVCREIATLPSAEIRKFIVRYMETADWGRSGYTGWTKVFVLSRVCFELSNHVPIRRLLFKDLLEGGRLGPKRPYDPEELVDAMYPLSLRNGELLLTGHYFGLGPTSGIGPDFSPAVLREFDYFTENFLRRDQ
jgi:hypothetical protein